MIHSNLENLTESCTEEITVPKPELYAPTNSQPILIIGRTMPQAMGPKIHP